MVRNNFSDFPGSQIIRAVQFLSLILCLFIASFSAAQDPKRFPLGSDVAVKNMASAELPGLGALSGEIEATLKQYMNFGKSAGVFPPHPYQCPFRTADTMNVTQFSWQGDSIASLAPPKFFGCAEPTARPDIPILVAPCVPVPNPFGLKIEVCVDPPPLVPNCCATYQKLVEKCGVPKGKPNIGFKLTFWWPENTAQVNNFGTVSFDPMFECANDGKIRDNTTDRDFNFKDSVLLNFIQSWTTPRGETANSALTPKMPYIPKGIPFNIARTTLPRPVKPMGQSHWIGNDPGDQVYQGEAHVLRTYLGAVGMLNNTSSGQDGFKWNCRCFYKLLDKWNWRINRIMNGWTELPKFLPFWRNYQESEKLDKELYKVISRFSSPATDMCASYRAHSSPWSVSDKYYDLYKAVGIQRPNANLLGLLQQNCYRGGSQIFPIVGQIEGPVSVLPSAAYLARRAFYLFGKRTTTDGKPLMPEGRRVLGFSDSVDKMQRVWPLKDQNPLNASRCFRGNGIPNLLQEGGEDFPKDLIKPSDFLVPRDPRGTKDDARYQHWNQRSGCMCPYIGKAVALRINGKFVWCRRTSAACRQSSRGDGEQLNAAAANGGDGGMNVLGIAALMWSSPYPYLPMFGAGTQSIEDKGGRNLGQCELSSPKGELAPRRMDYDGKPKKANFWDPVWEERDGGLQCDQRSGMCE